MPNPMLLLLGVSKGNASDNVNPFFFTGVSFFLGGGEENGLCPFGSLQNQP